MKQFIIYSLILAVCSSFLVKAQQVNITRIGLMPDKPSPYLMRNWKNTAIGYDSLVYNYNLTGTYLPLIADYSNTINYPNHGSYGLRTVVGTTSPNSFEAINVLPSVIGATLSGIDKSNQNGHNYPLMCEEYFNKQNGELVYLNNPSTITGDDWWYETMPNVFFYQLNYLYPNTGDYNFQFTTIANRWLNAVKAMGGKTAPWHVPNMNYRAWNLLNNTGNTSSVPEPEASGAIAWLLYNAYTKTNNADYRIGAEWCLEYLNALQSNPSYELQLGYGVYAAARMNAEIGTNYDIPKLVNWCFNFDNDRSWGSILGTWGGYDVDGLIGEVNGTNDYAFMMNTFELAGALVPMVRYDDRFAKAIGKWMLNASNAARLLYPNYLPDANQDSYQWAHQFDPHSYISHEAMRQSVNSVSPFATGDAISGGWGQTTLALYGASHVGIFGGIIDTTNVEGILKLDLLKTDYYHAAAYPTYLFFNPYTTSQQIQFNSGAGTHDLYDAVGNSFIQKNAGGVVNITVPASSAIVVVITPSGGTITYNLNKTLSNGVIIDFNNGQTVNFPPRIKSLSPDSSGILINRYVNVYCTAEDKNNDTLNYTWNVSGGTITGSGPQVMYTAPGSPGDFTIRCIVDDNHGGRDTTQITIHVFISINHPPVINMIKAKPRKLNLNASSTFNCSATDPDNDTLTYSWSSLNGNFTGSGSSVTWNAPAAAGNYYIACLVADNHGGSVKDSLNVEVRDFSIIHTGQLIAYYPFSGNAVDLSGNGFNGFAQSVTPVPDRFNNPNSAYSFDGVTSYIQVANNPLLNFSNAITLNFWMKIGLFYDREQYPVSHGNYVNRWKVSITNNRIRWTVKTTAGIKDLDSEILLALNKLYMVTCYYDGSDYEVYINGELDAFTTFNGTILSSPVDLTIGKVLPGDNNYNFNGVLDDIRLYDYGLPLNMIENFYDIPVNVKNDVPLVPVKSALYQNYPNPFNPSTTISFNLEESSRVTLDIFNPLGERIVRLINENLSPGYHKTIWNAARLPSGIYICSLITGNKVFNQKIILLK